MCCDLPAQMPTWVPCHMLLTQWCSYSPQACALEWLRFSQRVPFRATTHPFMLTYLSVESRVQLCSSVGAECGAIGVLLLRPITSHHFIFMRDRLDIKFPCSGLSIAPVIGPSQSALRAAFVSSAQGFWRRMTDWKTRQAIGQLKLVRQVLHMLSLSWATKGYSIPTVSGHKA